MDSASIGGGLQQITPFTRFASASAFAFEFEFASAFVLEFIIIDWPPVLLLSDQAKEFAVALPI